MADALGFEEFPVGFGAGFGFPLAFGWLVVCWVWWCLCVVSGGLGVLGGLAAWD